ncbi:MAG: HdeD family acid-resistance protein, partial [Dehalococcoidia bacterium]
PDKWLLLTGGIVSTVLGIIMLSNAGFGAVLIITIVGVYMVLFGVLLISMGISLKNSARIEE